VQEVSLEREPYHHLGQTTSPYGFKTVWENAYLFIYGKGSIRNGRTLARKAAILVEVKAL